MFSAWQQDMHSLRKLRIRGDDGTLLRSLFAERSQALRIGQVHAGSGVRCTGRPACIINPTIRSRLGTSPRRSIGDDHA
jgi:hypothetical protein